MLPLSPRKETTSVSFKKNPSILRLYLKNETGFQICLNGCPWPHPSCGTLGSHRAGKNGQHWSGRALSLGSKGHGLGMVVPPLGRHSGSKRVGGCSIQERPAQSQARVKATGPALQPDQDRGLNGWWKLELAGLQDRKAQ